MFTVRIEFFIYFIKLYPFTPDLVGRIQASALDRSLVNTFFLRQLFNVIVSWILGHSCIRCWVDPRSLKVRVLPWRTLHVLVWQLARLLMLLLLQLLLRLTEFDLCSCRRRSLRKSIRTNSALLTLERNFCESLILLLVCLLQIRLETDFVELWVMLSEVLWHFSWVFFKQLAGYTAIQLGKRTETITRSSHKQWGTHPRHIVDRV